MQQKPWLVITMRRTGGTSLAHFLHRSYSDTTLLNEPFNTKRRFGYIKTAFLETGDEEAAKQAIATALTYKPNVKHCIDTVPQEITFAVISEAQRLGYVFIVLERRNEIRRLASLFLAFSTGMWRSEQAQATYEAVLSGELVPKPINLDWVRHDLKMDAMRRKSLRTFLNDHDIPHHSLVHEELYNPASSSRDNLQAIARDIAAHLDQDALIGDRSIVRTGHVADKIGMYVENYEAMMTLLNETCQTTEDI